MHSKNKINYQKKKKKKKNDDQEPKIMISKVGQ